VCFDNAYLSSASQVHDIMDQYNIVMLESSKIALEHRVNVGFKGQKDSKFTQFESILSAPVQMQIIKHIPL
jgi:hypothetical protein